MNIQDIRKQYPQYNDLSDQELADGFHSKFYSDIPKNDFYSKIGFNQPSKSSGIGRIVDSVIKGGGAELETLGDPDNPAAAAAVMGAVPTLASGAVSWIPAGLSMVSPVTISGEGIKRRRPEEMAQTAKDIQETLTVEPPKQSEGVVRGVSYPIELAAKAGEKTGEFLESKGYPKAGAVARFTGEAAPFILPGIPKAIKSIRNSGWYRTMTIKERGLVDAHIENIAADIDSGNMTINDIRKAWKDPANREALINKYVKGTEEVKGEALRTPGEPAQIPKIVPRNSRREPVNIRPAQPGELVTRQPEQLEDVPTFEPQEPIYPERVNVPAVFKTMPENELSELAAVGNVHAKREINNRLIAETPNSINIADRPSGETAPEPPAVGAVPAEPTKPKRTTTPGIEDEHPIYQIMNQVKAEGGFNKASLLKQYGAEEVKALMKKRPGIVTDNGTKKLDEVAQLHNMYDDDLMMQMLGMKNKKELRDAVNIKKYLETTDFNLVKKGYEPAESIEAFNLDKGDKVIKGNEVFKVTGEEEGHLILKDGETLKVPLDETLSINGIKKKGGNTNLQPNGLPKGTLFSGLDITQTLDVLRGLKGNIKEAIPHLEAIGRKVYESGKQTFSEWQTGIKSYLGDLWESFKDNMKAVWDRVSKPLRNEKGAVGKDINDPVIKKREIKDKDKKVRFAPEIRKSEFEAIRDMSDLRQKPLGGWIENPLRTFEELGPKIKEIFYRPIKEAENAAKRNFQKIYEQSEKIRKSLPRKSSERIGTYAIHKQAGGDEILAKMGVKEIPELTPTEMKAYNWMRNGLETYYKKIQEARAASGKEPFGHVEDYFTFARQLNLIEELGFSPIFSRERLLSNFFHRKTTPFRFEKHRVGGISRADLDAFGVFNRYMESATRHVNLSPAIAKGREMMNTFKDAEGKNWILRDEKPAAAKFLTEWLDFQAGQRKPQLPNIIEKGLTKLNKNLAFAVLSANLRSALIQPTAIINTVSEIGPRWTFEGVKSILDGSGMEKSNVLFTRQFDVNVTESLAGMPGKLGKAKQWAGNMGMKPLQFLDFQTAKATWNGAYKKAKSEGMGERDAVNYADDTVTRTQGSAMPSDLSPIQRTALGKAISMFQTFVINQWGFLTRDVLGIKNQAVNRNMAIKKAAAFVIGTTLFNILYEDVLGIPSPMPSPINAFTKALDEGDEIPSATADAALEIAQLVPIVGGGLRYGSSILGAPAEYIMDVGKLVSPNYTGYKRPIGELVGKGLGVPGTAQIGKIVRINERGGSPIDMALGRYPEKEKKLKPTRKLKKLKN